MYVVLISKEVIVIKSGVISTGPHCTSLGSPASVRNQSHVRGAHAHTLPLAAPTQLAADVRNEESISPLCQCLRITVLWHFGDFLKLWLRCDLMLFFC